MFVTETDYSLALYGIESGVERMRSFHETVTAWLRGIGLSPDQVLIGRPGQGDIAGDLSYVTSALDGAGFAGVESEEITVSPEDSKATTTQFVVNATCSDGRYAVVAVRGTVANYTNGRLVSLAQGLIEALSPSYGFGHHMALFLEPQLYALGKIPRLFQAFQPPEDEEDEEPEDDPADVRDISRALIEDPDKSLEQIVQWGKMAMPMELYRKGILRDFYPWNFLNKAQRSASVEGVTLEEWIKADRSRGKIGPAPCDLAFWAIEPNRIDEIKPVLKRNKVIFDYRDFVHS
jgi:hypothetical protein